MLACVRLRNAPSSLQADMKFPVQRCRRRPSSSSRFILGAPQLSLRWGQKVGGWIVVSSCFVVLGGIQLVEGQSELPMTTSTLSQPVTPQPTGEELIEPSWETQRNARTLLLTLPAPRGQIVDRNGLPLAQTRVAQNLALNFPTPLTMSDAEATRFARQNVEFARALLPHRQFSQTDDFLLRFYQHRGMLPLILVEDLRPDEIDLVKGRLPDGLRLLPSYVRVYPNGPLAGHVIGYCSKTGGVPDRPVQNNDSIWPDFEGREGLEQTFNAQLTGRPGQLNIVMDRTGAKVTERVSIPPQPGANVVTSLDRDLQALCERVLEKRAKRGALVFIQPSTGDILALASWPRIDPNAFTPSISPEAYRALEEDPHLPLLPRAYRSAYPPGSTFKVFTGIAALESGAVDPYTTIDCPASITVGRTTFRNWKKSGSGHLALRGALEQSCNTWFYRAGMRTGADPIIEWAQRCGLGQRTGIPLRAESDGRIPTQQYWKRVYGYEMLNGDICNMSIGQGDILISPLQMAQAMVPIANGGTVLQSRLVRQVQAIDNTIQVAYQVRAKSYLGMRPEYLDEIREGLESAVHGRNGTGGRAAPSGLRIAGKTGTAQWGPKTRQRTAAWFCGYAPADAPDLAFAAVFEGDPNVKIGGGSHAAPMIGDVLKELYSNKGKKKEAPSDDVTPSAEDDEMVVRAELAGEEEWTETQSETGESGLDLSN